MKLSKKEQYARILHERLKQVSGTSEVNFGTRVMSFEDLKDVSKMLRKNLLQNRYCSQSLYEQLLLQYSDKRNSSNGFCEEFCQDLQGLAKTKSVCATLTSLGNKLVGHRRIYNKDVKQNKMNSSGLKRIISDASNKEQSKDKLIREDSVDYFDLLVNARVLQRCVEKDLQRKNITGIIRIKLQ